MRNAKEQKAANIIAFDRIAERGICYAGSGTVHCQERVFIFERSRRSVISGEGVFIIESNVSPGEKGCARKS